MHSLMSVLTLVEVAVLIAILFYIDTHRDSELGLFPWLAGMITFTALASLTYLTPDDLLIGNQFTRGFFLISLLILQLLSFGGLVINDLIQGLRRVRLTQLVLLGGIAWLASIYLGGQIEDGFIIGQDEWLLDLIRAPDISSYATMIGLAIMGSGLILTILSAFYREPITEQANRALFWLLLCVITIFGFVLTGSGTEDLAIGGMILLTAAGLGASLATHTHQVFDVRSSILSITRSLIFITFAAGLIFLALFVVIQIEIEANREGLIFIIATSLAIAAVFVPLRQGVEFGLQNIVWRATRDAAKITRSYSDAISQSVDLDSVLYTASVRLPQLLEVRSSCLILLTNTFALENAVQMVARFPGSDLDNRSAALSLYSPLYRVWALKREAITQYDIDHLKEMRRLSREERMFLAQSGMSAYAPIVLEQSLIGILAVGPKLNDTPFYRRDLELLSTLAQQSGIALRNARLVDDMHHLNRSMQSLNRTLRSANDQLNRMDSVKSDFVTIASHELRTPLSQIRGYTDIIDSLNASGLLDKDQTEALVSKLRKATERMEELIAAMLDVSQLDVNAMDLHFTETSVEAVLRMAIEPLTEAIKQRKLTLAARGLRGLPTIQADLQRLVQAFRNIIVNAIKFTPDGGRIDIRAKLEEADTITGADYVLIKITDTGVGIDRKNLEMIFKKFFRAYDPMLHSTGSTKFLGAGPGLGLTIARGVIEGHGGEVWAESAEHDPHSYPGTTFWVRLPINTPATARRVLSFEGDAAANAIRRTDEHPQATTTTTANDQRAP